MQTQQEDQTFTRITAADIQGVRHFENCRFKNCDFSYANLYNIVFADCSFEDCNLSLADVSHAGFQQVSFKGCKLTGVYFDKCVDFLFEVHCDACILDNAVFFKKKNKKAIFNDCSMIETDFTECDLTDAQFNNCNLSGAFFSRTVLKGADLRSSYNFIIDPEDNQLKKARFSVHGLPGLLNKYDIRIDG